MVTALAQGERIRDHVPRLRAQQAYQPVLQLLQLEWVIPFRRELGLNGHELVEGTAGRLVVDADGVEYVQVFLAAPFFLQRLVEAGVLRQPLGLAPVVAESDIFQRQIAQIYNQLDDAFMDEIFLHQGVSAPS